MCMPPSSIHTEILDAYRATLTAQVGAPTTDITKDNLSKKRWCANLGDETEKKVCEEGKILRKESTRLSKDVQA